MKTYLYCVTEKQQYVPKLKGVFGLPVQQLIHKDLQAHFSNITEKDLQTLVNMPQGQSVAITHPAIAHGKVIEKMHTAANALPFQYLTVFKQTDLLTQFLEENHFMLADQLQNISGCAEFGLRGIFKEDPNDRGDKQAVSSGTAFLQQKLQAYLAEGRKSAHAEKWCRDLKERFSGMFEDVHQAIFTRRQLQFELNFLVKRENFEAFKKQYQQFSALPSPVSFMLNGPWAPYHFVDIPQ